MSTEEKDRVAMVGGPYRGGPRAPRTIVVAMSRKRHHRRWFLVAGVLLSLLLMERMHARAGWLAAGAVPVFVVPLAWVFARRPAAEASAWIRLRQGLLEVCCPTESGLESAIHRILLSEIVGVHVVRDAAPPEGRSARAAALDGAARVVRIDTASGHVTVLADVFGLGAEQLAERIRELVVEGEGALAAEQEEADAHAQRFAAPRTLKRTLLPNAARFVELSEEGIRVGSTRADARLLRWRDVVLAHATDGGVAVALVSGETVHVPTRLGVDRRELVTLLAPRWVNDEGSVGSALDLARTRR